ncbi:MAG: carboxylate-amine ligase [Solirubrobacteraceae bacterium]
MDIDFDRARAVFEASTDFTVGIEEEFQVLDRAGLGLVPRYSELQQAALADPVLADSVAGELIASEIEIRSGRGETFAAAVVAQRERRRGLFALAAERGLALGATGTHPFSDYRDQQIIDTDHYRRVEQGLKYVAWRNNTFSLHVHVGVCGADRAVRVCDRLRPVLPLLLAISANSPFLEGRDTGLASARTQIFTRSFPRCGIPDAFGSWEEYVRYISFLAHTNSIVEYTQVWWSVRPHFSFGTVEVRICDVQSNAAESEALAGLIASCIAQAALDFDDGVLVEDLPGRLIEENMWRATRYGLDGELLDLRRAEPFPAPAAAERLLSWTEPARRQLGIEVALPARNGAQRLRDRVDAGETLAESFAATVAETRATYSESEAVEV